MKGAAGSEPDGIAGECFWILGMTSRPDAWRTAAELHTAATALAARLGEPPLTRQQVQSGLARLARRDRPLAERDRRAHRGCRPAWRLTSHGRRMARVWDGEPDREPCGLGWPW